jgi:cell division septation protein DedD
VQKHEYLTDSFQFTSIQAEPEVVALSDDVEVIRHDRNSEHQDHETSKLFATQRQGNWIFYPIFKNKFKAVSQFRVSECFASPTFSTKSQTRSVLFFSAILTLRSFKDGDSDALPLGPQPFGLVPVRHPPPPPETTSCHCNCHTQLEKKFCALERKLTSLQNKHDILQQSHDKLSQLVEAQNHLLACYTAPPPTREALANFTSRENKFIKSPDIEPSPSHSPTHSSTPQDPSHSRPFSETPDLPPDSSMDVEEEFFTLPRRATARDIIRLWEEGSRVLPPVKNWSPAQKMKVQSKLARWKKIIDILKTDCNGDMTLFEEKYSNGNGDLLPVTTILALHENQLSSHFLSKGFSNVKQNTIELKSPVSCKKEFVNDLSVEGGFSQDAAATNRYVLPRKVTARDVVHLWDVGCDEFPAIGTWSKAQKIGQETKIFRWKKIVDLFKIDCNSDWEMFCERYSNDKGELLPLATILAKHEAMYAQDHVIPEKQPPVTTRNSATHVTTPTRPATTSSPPTTPKSTTPTTSDSQKLEKSARDPDAVTLPRKVTAFEVVRYWTDGCETFGPVKDWTRAQKMGQETKISRWKKIYEIFRFQCCRDWDEFCRRYTNQRGELLPIATILAKYEAENPIGAPSYKQHENESHDNITPGFASQVIGESCATSFTDNGYTLPQAVDVDITVTDAGEYVLPEQLTAVQALSLWEHGTEQVPPMRNWSKGQTKQPELVDNIRRVAEVFERDCGSHFRRFLDRFSDTDGELLPLNGIVYSSHCRKYSPFFTEFQKNVKHSRSRGEQYELPKRVGAKEIVWLWDHGCRDFPPVKTWSSAQKLRYTTKLSRWRKIADIFHEKCDSNWRIYEEKYSNANGDLLALSTVISMQDETESECYASMIKRSPEHNGEIWNVESQTSDGIDVNNDSTVGHNVDHMSDNEVQHGNETESKETSDQSKEFYLPKKVNALDIINYWENGFGDMPPVSEWTTLQRFRQRSKISRWSKIYDIYKNHCRGDLAEFEKLYSDDNGQLLPATTIISMYESRVDADQYSENETLPKGPVVRKYTLPRKVDAKDIVRLWEEGNEHFPPIAAWTKADKIGQETKIFRWKKIVDIFKNHCDCDWEYFEDLFSNEFGELLPTSAIIAKFETSFLKR